MAHSLYQQTLLWSCYDPDGLVAATAESILRPMFSLPDVQSRCLPVDTPESTLSLSPVPGICLWHLRHTAELRATCHCLRSLRQRRIATLQIVFLSRAGQAWKPILLEAGAQAVVSRIPSLQSVLKLAVKHAGLSRQGTHPLTQGLIERLPGAALDADQDDKN